ncbi:centrosome-associated protein CEP250-like isoform X2 [Ornithodoros turicata]|uniref:centrosome-associated protein CEP250-like isoform X2 n=1 Tax=Ornithodoros turicata TaxID=34597 RepID=UPI003139241F
MAHALCGVPVKQRIFFWEALLQKISLQVEEYRARCNRLEKTLSEFSNKEVLELPEEQEPVDLPSALADLRKEKEKCAEYHEINVQLQRQLEVTTRTNGMLSSEVNRLSEEWQSTREDLVQIASVDDAFSEHMSHGRSLLHVWKMAEDLRRELRGTRAEIDAELSDFKVSLDAICRSIFECCSGSSDTSQLKTEHCLKILESMAHTLMAAIEKRKAIAVEWKDYDAKLETVLPKLREIVSMPSDTDETTTLISSAFTDLLSCYEADFETFHSHQGETSAKMPFRHVSFEEGQSSAAYFQQITESLAAKHKNVTAELNSQIRALNEENETLHNKLKKVQEDKQKCRMLLEETQAHERAVHNKLNESTKIQQSRVAELRDEVKKREQTASHLEMKLDSAQKENAEIASKMARLEAHASKLEGDNETLKRDQQALQTALKNVNAVNEDLRTHNETLAVAIKELEKYKFQLSRLKSEQDLKCSALSEQNASLERTRNDLIAEGHRLRGLLTDLEATKSDLEGKVTHKMKESNDFQSKLLLVSSQKENLSIELKRLEERAAMLEKNGSRLAEENQALMHACGEAKEALEASLEEREALSHNLQLCQDEREALQAEKFAVCKELAKTSEEKKSLALELEDVKAEKNRLNERIKTLTHEWESKTHKLKVVQESLTGQLKEMEDEFSEKLREQQHLRKAEVDRLEQEKMSLKQRLEQNHYEALELQKKKYAELQTKYGMEVASYNVEIQTVQQTLEAKVLQFEDMQTQLESAWEQERESLTKCLNQAKDETTRVKQLFEECRQEYEATNAQLESDLMATRSDNNSLKVSLEQLRAEKVLDATVAESQCNVLRKELDRATKERAKLERLLKESDTACQSMQEDLADLRTRSTNWESRASELLCETEKLRQELSHSTDDCEQLKQHTADLQLQLDELSKEKENTLADAAEKFRSEQQARANMAEECMGLRQALQEALRQKQALENQRDVAESSLKECSAEVETITALNSQSEARTQSALQEASHWKQKVAALVSECEQKCRERSDLTLKLQEVQHQLRLANEAREADRQRWTRSMHSLEEKRKELEKRVLDSAQELHSERLESSGLQGRIAALESRHRTVSEAKKTTEDTLQSLYTSLRCILGVWSGNDASCTMSSLASPQNVSRRDGPISSSPLMADDQKETVSKSPSPGDTFWGRSIVSSVDSLVQHVHTLEMERDEAHTTVSRYEREVSGLRDDVSAFEDKLKQAEERIQNLDSEKSNLYQKSLSQRQKISELTEEVEAARRETAYISDKLSETNLLLSLKRQEFEKLQETSALQEAKHSASVLQQDSASTLTPEARLTRLEIDKQTLKAKLEQERNQMKEKNYKCQALKCRLDEATAECSTLSNENKELEKKIQLVITSKTTLEKQIREQITQTMAFSEKLIKETAKSTELENEKNSLERKLKVADDDIAALTSENRRNSAQIRELKRKLSTLESSLLNASVRIAGTGRENVKHHEPPNEVIEGLNQVIESLKRENKRLEKEVCTLQQQLSDTINGFITPSSSREHLVDLPTPQRSTEKEDRESARSKFSCELSVLREQNQRLETKVRDLQDELSHVSYERSHMLSKEHRKLSDEIRTLRAALDQKTELSVAHECNHHLEVNALEGQVSSLKSQLAHERSFNEQAVAALRRSDTPWSDLGSLRDLLDRSLHTVSETPERLASEAQRLGSAVEDQLARHRGHVPLTPSKLGQSKLHTPRS